MSFSETLRQLRETAGLTQVQLAQRSGVPLRTIQGWEQGYRCPVSSDFFKLVRALGVPADAFAETEVPGKQPKAKAPHRRRRKEA
jgi:transcriptional regulator with XRE-family HTH domain